VPLAPWVIAVARNKMIDDLRRRHRRPEVGVDLSEFHFEGEDQQPAIEAHDLARVLKRLPDRNREISIDEHRWVFRSRSCGKTRNDGDRGRCDVAPKP
jgi:RNA polymerase sigma-70 factor, ECF subfamily